MELIIWIFQTLLALVFAGAAMKKLNPSTNNMLAGKQSLPDRKLIFLKILGVLELLGVIGIIVPQLINVYPILTPVTAVCFVLVLTGALFDKIKSKEMKMLPLIVVCILMSIVVAYYRF
ncbi:MAG: DoxX family protein [Saprospiraceae bacterium]|nr:DoxX family protein [Saprospiraceae bacterium]